MIAIGIDPGTKTGWAVCEDGRVIESGVQVFDLSRGESPGMRFLRFRRWLSQLFTTLPRNGQVIVGFERAHHRGGPATEIGVGMCTRVEEVAADLGFECVPVHTATLKKWACGNGRAEKHQMVGKASGIRGQPVTSDDEADAICIAAWAYAQVA